MHHETDGTEEGPSETSRILKSSQVSSTAKVLHPGYQSTAPGPGVLGAESSEREGLLGSQGGKGLFFAVILSGVLLSSLQTIFFNSLDDDEEPRRKALLSAIPAFIQGIAGIVIAPYATEYGIRKIYLLSVSTICLTSLGMFAFFDFEPPLYAFRVVQAIAAGPLLSLAVATVAGYGKAETRGLRIGTFLTVFTIFGSLFAFLSIPSADRLLEDPPTSPTTRGSFLKGRLPHLAAAALGVVIRHILSCKLPSAAPAYGESSAASSESVTNEVVRRKCLNPFRAFSAIFSHRDALIVTLVTAPMLTIIFEGLGEQLAGDAGKPGEDGKRARRLIYLSSFSFSIGSAAGSLIAGIISDRIARLAPKETKHSERLKAAYLVSLVVIPACFATSTFFHPLTPRLHVVWYAVLGAAAHVILGVGTIYVVEAQPKRAVEALAVVPAIQLIPSFIFGGLGAFITVKVSFIAGSAMGVLASLGVFFTFRRLVRAKVASPPVGA